jgi:hypothetical protein
MTNAKSGSDLLDTIEQAGIAPSLSDEKALQLAEAPGSNNAELTLPKLNALDKLETALKTEFVEPQNGDGISAASLAKHLAAEEIASSEGAAILSQANKFVKHINEVGAANAPSAVQWLEKTEKYLSEGGALTSTFVLSALDESIMIMSAIGDPLTVQTVFIANYDPTDPSSDKQIASGIMTDGAMQDSE